MLQELQKLRTQIGEQRFADEPARVNALKTMTGLGAAARAQMGGENVTIASGDAIVLATGDGIDGVAFDGDGEELRRLRMALAALPGARRALVRATDGAHRFIAE